VQTLYATFLLIATIFAADKGRDEGGGTYFRIIASPLLRFDVQKPPFGAG
jgi:hypothetical protein